MITMARCWILVLAALTALAACTNGQESVFDPEQGSSLCRWFTDGEVRTMIGSAIEDGDSDEEMFKDTFGRWGCWWQTRGGGVVLAPFTESGAHPEAMEAASFPHPALSKDASVVDWPEGDWPPQIESGVDLSVLLRIEGRSELVSFSLSTETEVDVDTALSVADEMLNRMGWVG